MGIFGVLFICSLFFATLAGLNTANADTDMTVLSYGATGEGEEDDYSEVFLKAWDVMCHYREGISTIVIPEGMTFLVNPIVFKGPCNASAINFKIFGTILAPEDPNKWLGIDSSTWLGFSSVSRLHVSGYGTFDGRGFGWWNQSCIDHPGIVGCTTLAPTALKFWDCTNCSLSDVNFINSAQTHVSVYQGNRFLINQIHIRTPGNTPNTDGIHIHASLHLQVRNSIIGCGDDCISIGDRTFDIRIDNIDCGPGHGISIGSLGKGGTNVTVEDIHVSNVRFHGTTNGARIKTWQGGQGYVRGITFKQLYFIAVKNPIIIDQYYCTQQDPCNAMDLLQTSAVQISNVSYELGMGTSSTTFAISLHCSQVVPCTGLNFAALRLTPEKPGKTVSSRCVNAEIDTNMSVQPNISCY